MMSHLHEMGPILVLLLAFVFDNARCEMVSPCPSLFQYEESSNENDRWYGNLTLISNVDITGVWLSILLDKPAIQLGNWLGETSTVDNQVYLIKNKNHKLEANTPLKIRFYIKYNPGETPPHLKQFRLNGKTVCPDLEVVN